MHETYTSCKIFLDISCIKFCPNHTKKMSPVCAKIHSPRIVKFRFLCTNFSQNSQLHYTVTCRCSVISKFTQIGQEIRSTQVWNPFKPLSSVWLPLSRYSWNSCLLCKESLQKIFPTIQQPVYSLTVGQTEGRTWSQHTDFSLNRQTNTCKLLIFYSLKLI